MKKFLRNILLFLLPIAVLAAVYAAIDVFRVVKHYDTFYAKGYRIGLNRAYGSTVTYVNQNLTYHYNAFIFGNSRSLFFEAHTWQQHLPNDSRPFHFDASGGSVRGLHDKIAFIHQTGGELKYALLVLDHDILGNDETKEGYLFVEPPQLRGYSNVIDFHKQHFVAFLNLQFLRAWADYSLFGTYRPYMKHLLTEDRETYDAASNEISEPLTEQQIAQGIYYDEAHLAAFDGMQYENTCSTEHLSPQAVEWLRDIRRIFDLHHTEYRVIISPLYDQLKLKPETLKTLCDIFGNSHVYDFSGTNKWSGDYHNYYEPYHYRPHVAAEIMDIVYQK